MGLHKRMHMTTGTIRWQENTPKHSNTGVSATSHDFWKRSNAEEFYMPHTSDCLATELTNSSVKSWRLITLRISWLAHQNLQVLHALSWTLPLYLRQGFACKLQIMAKTKQKSTPDVLFIFKSIAWCPVIIILYHPLYHNYNILH